jgi:hypothetical protein
MYTGRLLCWTIRGSIRRSIRGRGNKCFAFSRTSRPPLGPPTLFAMSTEDFLGRGVEKVGKAAGKWSWPLTPMRYECSKCSASPYNKRLGGLRQTTSPSPSREEFCVGRRADLDGKIWALKYVLASLQQQWRLQWRQMLVLQRVSNEMLHRAPLLQVV